MIHVAADDRRGEAISTGKGAASGEGGNMGMSS